MLHCIPTTRSAIVPDDPFLDLTVSRAVLEEFRTVFRTPLSDSEAFDHPALDAFAVVFDLEGFTAFCAQPDAHIVVPDFIEQFSEWLFGRMADFSLAKNGHSSTSAVLDTPLPFFSKFMGDGYMMLWKADPQLVHTDEGLPHKTAKSEVDGDLMNIMSVILDVVRDYPAWYSKIEGTFSLVPARLRCGGARGRVVGVQTDDFVGPCINQASRLQKLGALSFAVSTRGMPRQFPGADLLNETLHVERVKVRGFGDELVFVVKNEWLSLSSSEQAGLKY